jgi:hypothetical protein
MLETLSTYVESFCLKYNCTSPTRQQYSSKFNKCSTVLFVYPFRIRGRDSAPDGRGWGVPTYPFKIMEHGRVRGTYLPLQNYGTWCPVGYLPTYPLGIAERWHRNLPSLAKEWNPGSRLKTTYKIRYMFGFSVRACRPHAGDAARAARGRHTVCRRLSNK